MLNGLQLSGNWLWLLSTAELRIPVLLLIPVTMAATRARACPVLKVKRDKTRKEDPVLNMSPLCARVKCPLVLLLLLTLPNCFVGWFLKIQFSFFLLVFIRFRSGPAIGDSAVVRGSRSGIQQWRHQQQQQQQHRHHFHSERPLHLAGSTAVLRVHSHFGRDQRKWNRRLDHHYHHHLPSHPTGR